MMTRKLTLDQVREIRARYGGVNPPSIRQLAIRYGVSKSLIWKIIHNQIYREKEGVSE